VPVDPVREYLRAIGARGGQKGGRARARALSPEERRDIARKAAAARWGKKRKQGR
jgi:hypothetical protein